MRCRVDKTNQVEWITESFLVLSDVSKKRKIVINNQSFPFKNEKQKLSSDDFSLNIQYEQY